MRRNFLEGLGLEKETIDAIMEKYGEDIENAKKNASAPLQATIDDLSGQIASRDTDLEAVRQQLASAQEDASKYAEAQNAIATLQGQYAHDKEEWEAQRLAQAQEFAIKTAAGKLDFTSGAAQRDFIRGAIDADLKLDGETLIGFTDYLEKYKEADPTAFKEEVKPTGEDKPKPTIVEPTGGAPKPNETFGFHFNGVRPNSED